MTALYVKGHILDPGLSFGFTLSNAQAKDVQITGQRCFQATFTSPHGHALMFSFSEGALLLRTSDLTINHEELVYKRILGRRVSILFGQAGMAVFLSRKWVKVGMTSSILEKYKAIDEITRFISIYISEGAPHMAFII